MCFSLSPTLQVACHSKINGYGIRCNSLHPGYIETPMVVNGLKGRNIDLSVDDAKSRAVKKAMNMGMYVISSSVDFSSCV